MNLSAAAWAVAIALILAVPVLSRLRRRREEIAWRRDTGQALANVADPVRRDFRQWEAQIGGSR